MSLLLERSLMIVEELRKNRPSCQGEREKVVGKGMVGKIRGYACDGSYFYKGA